MAKLPKAVFLDRDGVINEEVDLLCDPSLLKLIPGSAKAIRILNERGIPAIVVTNQPVVARNLCTEEELKHIHRVLRALLRQEAQAKLDAIYYCPHYPDISLVGGNPSYLGECECRKPNIGLILRACHDFHLRPEECVLIGDSTRDIQTGKNAGTMTVLVSTGYGGRDGRYQVYPDLTSIDLEHAVDILMKQGMTRL